jgi:hypothetical protein
VTKRNVVLVCGGRDFKARRLLFKTLDLLQADKPITKLVQGFARGADRLAHRWALSRRVKSTGTRYEITGSMWDTQGLQAGYLRNMKMRDNELPDIVLAFEGGPGTQMMVDLAKEHDIITLGVLRDGTIVVL